MKKFIITVGYVNYAVPADPAIISLLTDMVEVDSKGWGSNASWIVTDRNSDLMLRCVDADRIMTAEEYEVRAAFASAEAKAEEKENAILKELEELREFKKQHTEDAAVED